MARTSAFRGSRKTGAIAASILLIGIGLAGFFVVRALLSHSEPERVATQRCTATTEAGSFTLKTEQADNAAFIAALGTQRGLPARAVTIAIATAMQESQIRNIDYGDRDSLGLFQQRPSQGWGSTEEIMDPVYSTSIFYDRLVAIPGYESMEITDAAQEVQRSGFPKAYAQHEGMARSFASALTGHSPASLTCDISQPSEDGAGAATIERLRRDYGKAADARVVREAGEDGPAQIEVRMGDARRAWSVAQWSVAVAEGQQIEQVGIADAIWTRETAVWNDPEALKRIEQPLSEGRVLITLAGPEAKD